MAHSTPEVWLRGPVPDVPPLLQPVAHALLQAAEEARRLAADLPDPHLWVRPDGLASAGFHLQHLAGAVDRLFTYARGDTLTPEQFEVLRAEGQPDGSTAAALVSAFDAQVSRAIDQLRITDPATLLDVRGVGRQQLPTTQFGLLFHAAEHAMRHVGQLLVTVRWALRG
jgi:uncharacterized damage-inducible protein DinB